MIYEFQKLLNEHNYNSKLTKVFKPIGTPIDISKLTTKIEPIENIEGDNFFSNAKLFSKTIEKYLVIKKEDYYKEYFESINKKTNKYQCVWCLKKLSSCTNYKKHIKSEICLNQHESKCYNCAKDFKCKQNLQYHLRNFVCGASQAIWAIK